MIVESTCCTPYHKRPPHNRVGRAPPSQPQISHTLANSPLPNPVQAKQRMTSMGTLAKQEIARPQEGVAEEVFAAALCAVEKYLADPEARCPEKLADSMRVAEQALEKYKPGELSISFNGGKDCHVMLIIIMAACYRRGRRTAQFPAVYVRNEDSFPQVDQFVSECARIYQLQVHTVAKSMKAALAEYLDIYPKTRAVFVGIRRQDPYGENLTSFQDTDHGWPSFERVHPILEWDYGDVWDFLRRQNIAYCGLYDLGYTSLGGVSNTQPNQALQRPDGQYDPAYMLADWSLERAGRG